MQEFIFNDEAEAQSACEWWQKQIEGLNDWRFTVHIKRGFEILEGRLADAHICWQAREAIVSLLEPNDRSAEWILDHEQCLLHEMIHCLVDAFMPKEEKEPLVYGLFEQHIEGMAWTLLKLRRIAYPEPPWRDFER